MNVKDKMVKEFQVDTQVHEINVIKESIRYEMLKGYRHLYMEKKKVSSGAIDQLIDFGFIVEDVKDDKLLNEYLIIRW